MKPFLNVLPLSDVLAMVDRFLSGPATTVPLAHALGRVLAAPITAPAPLPSHARSTMDGYAVAAASVFGASEANPAYLTATGAIAMGEAPTVRVAPGEAVQIATGALLPEGADSVVMVEYTTAMDATTIEVTKAIAPGDHIILPGEDFAAGTEIRAAGERLRPQDLGALAAVGITEVPVVQSPQVAVISTGDELVPPEANPNPGQIRDVNTQTLSAMITEAGGVPMAMGIVPDTTDALTAACRAAVAEADMVLISGGSSVGTRDLTQTILETLPDSDMLVQGIAISPGKPTLLAAVGGKPVWGLPGHVTSAMVVFRVVVRPFLLQLAGYTAATNLSVPARLTRNVASAQGRRDFIRVRLTDSDSGRLAEPVLGKSGLINTMVSADGLIDIGRHAEGLEADTTVPVLLF